MGIPEFHEGLLPEGVHQATLSEMLQRFAYGGTRRSYLGNLLSELYDLLWRVGGTDLAVGGSFITGEGNPRDIDCAILIPPAGVDIGSQRWDRRDLVHMDIKPCRSKNELADWYSFFQLDRARKRFKGCVQLEIPMPRTSMSEEALKRLDSEPLRGSPRGRFPGVPREDKIDVVARLIFDDLQEEKKKGESATKRMTRAMYKILKEKDPTKAAKVVLPDDFDDIWPDKKGKYRNWDDISDVRLKPNELRVIELTKLQLRDLPDAELERIYVNTLKRDEFPDALEKVIAKLIKSKK
jgi:hypothetical protein